MKRLLAILFAIPSLGWCDSKISALPSTTTLNAGDIIPVVTNPGTTPTNKVITYQNFMAGASATVLHSSGIAFGSATNTVTSDTNTFVYDDTNYTLFIGTDPQGTSWYPDGFGSGLRVMSRTSNDVQPVLISAVSPSGGLYFPWTSRIGDPNYSPGLNIFNISHNTSNNVTFHNYQYTSDGNFTFQGSSAHMLDLGVVTSTFTSAVNLNNLTASQCVQTDSNKNLISSGGSCGGGGGAGQLIYPATGTASFPYGASFSTVAVNAGTITIAGGYYSTSLSGAGFIRVSQHYAFVVAGSSNTLSVFDVANPASPVLLYQTASGLNDPEGMDIQWPYLYLTSLTNNTFLIYNISAPSHPTLVGSLADGTNLLGAGNVQVLGNYAYIVDNNVSGGIPQFTVVDISNPAIPIVVGSVSNANMQEGIDIRLAYPYAYVSSEYGIVVINITNPTSPTYVTYLTPAGSSHRLYGIDVYGKYLYAAGYGDKTIFVVGISTPSVPVSISSMPTGSYTPFTLHVYGGNLFTSSYDTNSVLEYSLANPAYPSTTTILTDSTHLSSIDDISINGNYLYATAQGTGNGTNAGFTILNIGAITTNNLIAGAAAIDNLEVKNDVYANRVIAQSGVQTSNAFVTGQLTSSATMIIGNVLLGGSAGTANQAIVSQGSGKAPTYASVPQFGTVTQFITSGTSWSAYTSGANITVECIGGGGGGGSSGYTDRGGGGGEYRKSVIAYTSGASVPIQIGQGGAGGTNASPNGVSGTNTTFNTSVVVCNGGGSGGAGGAGGTGGTGTVGYDGGSRGATNSGNGSVGGGGAAGPNGKGGNSGDQNSNSGTGGGGNGGGSNSANASSSNGTNGGNNSAGTGHGTGGTSNNAGGNGTNGGGGGGGGGNSGPPGAGGNGSTGTEWSALYGSGGGGGGGASYSGGANGGNGGLYGGGGGGGGVPMASAPNAGNGANGILVITYQAGGVNANGDFATYNSSGNFTAYDLFNASPTFTSSLTAASGIVGTTTNDSAAAGKVGEYISSASGGNHNFPATGTADDVTTIALTAGDWDISSNARFNANGAAVSEAVIWIGTTAGNSTAEVLHGDNDGDLQGTAALTSLLLPVSVPAYRVSLSGSVTYRLKCLASFTGGPPQVSGYRISARRVR